jgi:hypothetical protein
MRTPDNYWEELGGAFPGGARNGDFIYIIDWTANVRG